MNKTCVWNKFAAEFGGSKQGPSMELPRAKPTMPIAMHSSTNLPGLFQCWYIQRLGCLEGCTHSLINTLPNQRSNISPNCPRIFLLPRNQGGGDLSLQFSSEESQLETWPRVCCSWNLAIQNEVAKLAKFSMHSPASIDPGRTSAGAVALHLPMDP